MYVRDGRGFIPRVRLNGGEKDPKVCWVEGSLEANNIQPVPYTVLLDIVLTQIHRTCTDRR